MGPFILVAPMVIISGLVYCVVFLGPWALLSCLIVLGFFPFAVSSISFSIYHSVFIPHISFHDFGSCVYKFNWFFRVHLPRWQRSTEKWASKLLTKGWEILTSMVAKIFYPSYRSIKYWIILNKMCIFCELNFLLSRLV